jgi:hypothetical protein
LRANLGLDLEVDLEVDPVIEEDIASVPAAHTAAVSAGRTVPVAAAAVPVPAGPRIPYRRGRARALASGLRSSGRGEPARSGPLRSCIAAWRLTVIAVSLGLCRCRRRVVVALDVVDLVDQAVPSVNPRSPTSLQVEVCPKFVVQCQSLADVSQLSNRWLDLLRGVLRLSSWNVLQDNGDKHSPKQILVRNCLGYWPPQKGCAGCYFSE